MYSTPSFTRQGSQVRTLYHPPVISLWIRGLANARPFLFVRFVHRLSKQEKFRWLQFVNEATPIRFV